MANRPIGMYLICGFFIFVGFGIFLGAFSIAQQASQIPAGQPASVELFLDIIPFFMLLLGPLGVLTGILLWRASPLGLTTGLIWIVLWIIEEIGIALWILTGPEIVQQASSGIGATVVRGIVAVIMVYYLVTTGRRYVENDGTIPYLPVGNFVEN
jgi:hypothetical protein